MVGRYFGEDKCNNEPVTSKEKIGQYLLPVIKSELLHENENFEKLVSAPGRLITS